MPNSILPYLAELSPGIVRYIDDQQLEIDVEAIIGTEEIDLDHCVLRIKIRNFYLRLISGSVNVLNGSRYTLKLQKFNMEASETTSSRQRTSSSAKAEAAAGGKLDVWIPSVVAKFMAGGDLTRLRDRETTTENKITKEIFLITPLPNKTWQVGHEEFGDIRRADGNLLGSYFQEASEGGLNEPSPLCRIRLDGTLSNFNLLVALVVKTRDFRFEIIDHHRGTAVREASIAEREEFARKMKGKISGIALQRSIREATTAEEIMSQLKSNELLICFGEYSTEDVRMP
jgi:hypothetical protein